MLDALEGACGTVLDVDTEVAQKVCSRCRLPQSVTLFNRDRSRSDGLTSRCRPCNRQVCRQWAEANPGRKKEGDRQVYEKNRETIKARSQRWRQENRERWLEASRRWSKDNPERHAQHRRTRRALLAAAKIVPFTVEQLDAKMAYWGHRCWVCRGKFQAVDHVKPLAAGGGHLLANLRPICQSCNSKKRATWPLKEVMPR
jgi:5-methylcytosine-specific restriction endonuclease McrA